MDTLWAPWRMEYILGPKADECVFCLPQTRDEDKNRLVLYRGKHAFVIMNKYPYCSGHLLVAPTRHVMGYCDLKPEEYGELFQLSQACVDILGRVSRPEGFNLGFNLGSAAGAGIKEHLHYHVVPRWNGDSSFMAVIGDIRTVPEHLTVTYTKLKPLFDSLGEV